MLAMTFLSFVLVFMSLTIVQMIRTYDKGLTIKQVNQAGRAITDDISKALKDGQPGQIKLTNVSNGRLCIGNIMYLWNPVYSDKTPTPTTIDPYALSGAPITMARREVTNLPDCTNPPCGTSGCYNVPANSTNYSLLGGTARVLWAGVTPSPDGQLVKLTFIMGTYDVTEAANIRSKNFTDVFNTPTFSANQPICQPGSNGNYCAFAEFSTIVYLPNGE